jgi:hypothetical protein
VAWRNELPPSAVWKDILVRKPNHRNTINIKLSPNTINRDAGSMNNKKEKVLLKDMRASIPYATAVYLLPKITASHFTRFFRWGSEQEDSKVSLCTL